MPTQNNPETPTSTIHVVAMIRQNADSIFTGKIHKYSNLGTADNSDCNSNPIGKNSTHRKARTIAESHTDMMMTSLHVAARGTKSGRRFYFPVRAPFYRSIFRSRTDRD
jgi:hypothetical protein